MKLLLDQDVYFSTFQFLLEKGHEVLTAEEIGLSQARDVDLLTYAVENNRLFITRDRDFGNLVYVEGLRSGVVYLRLTPSTQEAVQQELHRVLSAYSEEELRQSFVVVEPGRHRNRIIPHSNSEDETLNPNKESG